MTLVFYGKKKCKRKNLFRKEFAFIQKVQAVPGGYGGQPVLYALPGGGVQQVYAPMPHQPTPVIGVPAAQGTAGAQGM